MAPGIVSIVQAPGAHSAHLPLDGIRVIDLTSNIAGPFASRVMADLGADVLHVEGPEGDDSRRMAPAVGDSSAYFCVVNRGKQCTTVDIGSEEGRTLLLGLIAEADVFVTNLRPDKIERLGIDAESLCSRFPRLIHASLSAYGARGVERDRPGYDAVLQSRSGIAAVTGQAEGPPVRAGVSILDMGSGTWLALGILAALYRREITGFGGAVATSLFETGAAWVSYHLAAHQITGEPSQRHGSGHPAFAPYGIYRTGHGDICIGVGGDSLFRQLCFALDRGDLCEDPRFASNNERTRNSELLREELESVLARGTAREWAQKLGGLGLPVDAVNQPEDLLGDPQSIATEILLEAPGPGGANMRIPGLPVTFDGERPKRTAHSR